MEKDKIIKKVIQLRKELDNTMLDLLPYDVAERVHDLFDEILNDNESDNYLYNVSDDEKMEIVNNILERYTNDEAGQAGKEDYKNMNNIQKVMLFDNALQMTKDLDDFDTNVIINFDYSNY